MKKARWTKLEDGTKQFEPEKRKPVSGAEINRETGVLSSMFTIAAEERGLRHRPVITKLEESPARKGFFTNEQIASVCAHLPAELAAVVQFGFATAWRYTEVVNLTWDRVDFSGRGRVWLDRGMTKNDEPRVFVMTTALRTLLEKRLEETEKLKRKGRIVAHVFFRERLVKQADGSWKMTPGQPIKSFVKAWRTACADAGYPGRIYHDLRRSAIRNFVRSGIGEQIAMQLSGHLTSSTFRRYNISADADLTDAADKLDAAAAQGTTQPERKPARVRAFRKRAS